jgi:hypothetical protein
MKSGRPKKAEPCSGLRPALSPDLHGAPDAKIDSEVNEFFRDLLCGFGGIAAMIDGAAASSMRQRRSVYSVGASVDRVGTMRDQNTDSAKLDNAKARTARISAVLRFVSVEEVETYCPLPLPIALQLGGFLMLAYGFAPGWIELGHTRRKTGNRKRRRTRKSNADYQRFYHERQKAKLTIVK